jgi:hypothetical protein
MQQALFLAAMCTLLFQIHVAPYRVDSANRREVIMLSVLVIGSGFEMLRISELSSVGRKQRVF